MATIIGMVATFAGVYTLTTSALGGGQAASASTQAAEALAEAGFDTKDKAAIEAIVRQYILDNPEIIPEAIQVLQSRQAARRIEGLRPQIETPFAKSFAGNPDGDVVLVEFADFACGFCRQSVEDVKKLIAEDPKLKVVFQELPILSEESETAAAWAMAAAEQGKYYAFHNTLYETGRPSQATIEEAARKVGLDMAKARGFVASGAARERIEQNINLARQLEFSGTPSWVVGNQVLSGAVGYDALKAAIAKAREAGAQG